MERPIFLALLIVALPLGAFAIEILHALIFRRMAKWNDKLSMAAMFTALGCALYLLFTEVLAHPHGIEKAYMGSVPWISFGGDMNPVRIDLSILVDNMTCVMLVVVTLVSSLVHLYSSSYMHGEERYSRFFSYLSLFTFSMLGLCIANNILILFIFWELVGLCSYFLIGFYIEKKSAGDASKKAFITNRVGDALFMTAIMIVFSVLSQSKGYAGKDVLSFPEIYRSIGELGSNAGPWVGNHDLLVIAGIFFFMGCVTKSAQFPLHIWLPDAMEGPTPVSALIHAATMVAAGVYMIVRMVPLLVGEGYISGDWFHSTPLEVIAIVGGFTSIFAGTIALVQNDLKKGLAYSTCSQLGYMAMAVGVGSTTGGMFHLFTHAFFKACLFLGAGSVIHAVHSQMMGDMGGLRKKMPITYWTFLISTLAIAGTPLFSGFMSKEMVLTSALAYGHMHEGSLFHSLPFYFAAITAVLTTFYMFRLVFLTFFGKGAWEDKKHGAHDDHAHAPVAVYAAPVSSPGHGAAAHGAHGHAPAAHSTAAAHDTHAAHDPHGGTPAAHDPHAAPVAAHGDHGHHGEPHESPWQMALPLVVLAVLALFSSGIAFPGLPGSHWFEHRLNDGVLVKDLMTESSAATEQTRQLFEPMVVHQPGEPLAANASEIVAEYHEAWSHAHHTVFLFSLCAVAFGITAAAWFFIRKRGVDYVTGVAPLRGLRTVLSNLWYVDAFFIKGFVPLEMKFNNLCAWFDRTVVDGIVNLVAWIANKIGVLAGLVDFYGVDGAVRGTGDAVLEGGSLVRKLVSGKVQDYVKWTVVGFVVAVAAVAWFGH